MTLDQVADFIEAEALDHSKMAERSPFTDEAAAAFGRAWRLGRFVTRARNLEGELDLTDDGTDFERVATVLIDLGASLLGMRCADPEAEQETAPHADVSAIPDRYQDFATKLTLLQQERRIALVGEIQIRELCPEAERKIADQVRRAFEDAAREAIGEVRGSITPAVDEAILFQSIRFRLLGAGTGDLSFEETPAERGAAESVANTLNLLLQGMSS